MKFITFFGLQGKPRSISWPAYRRKLWRGQNPAKAKKPNKRRNLKMRVERVKYIVSFIESLSAAERNLLQNIVFTETHKKEKSQIPTEKRTRGKYRHKQKTYTNEQKQQAMELRAQGMSYARIAKRLGIRKTSIYTVISQYRDKINNLPVTVR